MKENKQGRVYNLRLYLHKIIENENKSIVIENREVRIREGKKE